MARRKEKITIRSTFIVILSLLYFNYLLVFLQNLKLCRLAEFKDNQIQQLHERIDKEEKQIVELEKELLQIYQKTQDIPITEVTPRPVPEISQKTIDLIPTLRLIDTKYTQTLDKANDDSKENVNYQNKLDQLQLKILEKENDISDRDSTIEQLKSKITELEMNISLFRQQIGDKQSQIMFYEKHILELRGKIETAEKPVAEEKTRDSNESIQQTNEETLMLKVKYIFYLI